MTNQRQFFQRPRLWGLLCGLTLAVAQFFTPAGVGVAFELYILHELFNFSPRRAWA